MEEKLIFAIVSFVIGVVATALTARRSNRLKVAEFRQSWINALRDDIASYLTATQRRYNAIVRGEESWKIWTISNEASVFLYRIVLRINPNENAHKQEDDEFITALEKLEQTGDVPKSELGSHWHETSQEIIERGRKLLKREWETTKRFKWWGGA